MRVRVWGCRGSLPTPGPSTIRYGGNTTCLEIQLNSGPLIIIDAGSGIKALGKTLVQEQTTTDIYLFLTHAHWDHLLGFPFFLPAYSNEYIIHVRGGPRAKGALETYLKQQMQPPYFPVPFEVMQAQFDFSVGPPQTWQIGRATVIPVPISHPNNGYGFKIVEDGVVFVFIPDNELDYTHEGGLPREDYIQFCQGADLLMHDAQYTDDEYQAKKGWGHTSFTAVLQMSLQAEVKRFGLFHHDPDHTDADIDSYVDLCRAMIAQANSPLEVFATKEGLKLVI